MEYWFTPAGKVEYLSKSSLNKKTKQKQQQQQQTHKLSVRSNGALFS